MGPNAFTIRADISHSRYNPPSAGSGYELRFFRRTTRHSKVKTVGSRFAPSQLCSARCNLVKLSVRLLVSTGRGPTKLALQLQRGTGSAAILATIGSMTLGSPVAASSTPSYAAATSL